MIEPARLAQAFRESQGGEPRLFYAPGRVNLIGEHTDYNDGFVLPMAIEQGTLVAARARRDRLVRVRSRNLGEAVEIDLDRPGAKGRGGWIDYVEGVARALEARAVRLRGADLVLESDVPPGAGLSSSAALEISVGLALATLAEATIDRKLLAQAGQAAEHEYVGTRCGIMDPLIAALALDGHALLIDCRSLGTRPVPMASGARVVLCDSRVRHELASSEYNRRRAECEQGVALLREGRGRPGEPRALRDVTPAELALAEARLPEPVRRRCRHVVSENARTEQAARALASGDLAGFGRLMLDSHRSLRDDYEVSSIELDFLVELAAPLPGVYGARMTGGGFGGCTVNLVAAEGVPEVCRRIEESYTRRFGRPPGLLVTRACAGAREVTP